MSGCSRLLRAMDTPLLDESEQVDNANARPVNGGVFFVRQTHLGFCPPDVILHVRPQAIVLLNEEHEVAEYAYTNLVMWTQSKSAVTILLQSNLKRVVLRARGRRAARKIVMMLHDITQRMADQLHQKLALWGINSADLHSSSASQSEDWANPTMSSMFASEDGPQDDLDSFRLFKVQQTHMPNHPPVVMLRVDKEGVGLRHRHTGEELWSCSWYEMMMWRGDAAAVVIVFSDSNKQLELLSDQSQVIVETMTSKAETVRMSRERDFVKRTTVTATHKLPAAALEFRKGLVSFNPPKVTPHAKWKDTGKLGKIRDLIPFAGNRGLLENIQAREQLHAIFALADTDGGGSLDVHELGDLLTSLGVYSENGRPMGQAELELLMIDMDVFGNEVNFDGFVQWALSTDEGSEASGILKRRVAHRKKEVQASKDSSCIECFAAFWTALLLRPPF